MQRKTNKRDSERRTNRQRTKTGYAYVRFSRPLNKKGFSGRDIILAGVLLFVFAIGFFIARYASVTMTSTILDSAGWNNSFNQTDLNVSMYVENATETSGSMLDGVFLAVFIGLIFGILITSYLVRGHPVFMFFYFLLIVVAIILGVVFADVWDDLVRNTYADFGNTIDDFPITDHIITLLPIYLAIFGTLGMIIMFGKPGLERSVR